MSKRFIDYYTSNYMKKPITKKQISRKKIKESLSKKLHDHLKDTMYYVGTKVDSPMWGRFSLPSDYYRKCSTPETLLSEDSILAKADKLTNSDRNIQYGSFTDNAEVALKMYEAFKRGSTELKTAADVAIFMVFLKLARESSHPKEDNRVDGAGYLKLYDQELNKC